MQSTPTQIPTRNSLRTPVVLVSALKNKFANTTDAHLPSSSVFVCLCPSLSACEQRASSPDGVWVFGCHLLFTPTNKSVSYACRCTSHPRPWIRDEMTLVNTSHRSSIRAPMCRRCRFYYFLVFGQRMSKTKGEKEKKSVKK